MSSFCCVDRGGFLDQTWFLLSSMWLHCVHSMVVNNSKQRCTAEAALLSPFFSIPFGMCRCLTRLSTSPYVVMSSLTACCFSVVAPHIEELVLLPSPVLRLINLIDDSHLNNDEEYEGTSTQLNVDGFKALPLFENVNFCISDLLQTSWMTWKKSVRNMDQWFLCSSLGKTQEKDRSDMCSLNRESSCNSSVWYGSACFALLPEYGAKIFSDTFSFLWLWLFFFTLKMGAKHQLCVHIFFPYALEDTFTNKSTKVKVRITISPFPSLHVIRL